MRVITSASRKFMMLNVFFLLFHALSYSANVEDEDNGYVVYTDMVDAKFPVHTKTKKGCEIYSLSNASNRRTVVSRQGKFFAFYDDNYFMTEGVVHSLRLAMDLWEDRLNVSQPVDFYVCMSEDMPQDVAISTTVLYKRISKTESVPRSLSVQRIGKSTDDNGDGAKDTIKLNACVDWGCFWLYDDMYSGEYALTTYLLRHIAHILGFGSSVVDRGGRWGFAVQRTLSPFDRLLYYDGQRLSFSFTSSLIESFFKGNLSVKGTEYCYPLYNCKEFVQNLSGRYFSLGYDNIMEYPMDNNAQMLAIPGELLDVLGEIGWKVNAHDARIVCDSVDAQGYGSVYKNLCFRLEGPDSDGKDEHYVWYYQEYSDGTYITQEAKYGKHVEFQQMVKNELLDSFNCLQARVICQYGGKEYSYPLTLETRPYVDEIVFSNKQNLATGFYEFDMVVRQRGAESGIVTVSDDAGSVYSYDVTDGNLHVGPLVNGMHAYVDVSLENSYGYTIKYVELDEIPAKNRYNKRTRQLDLAVKVNGKEDNDTFCDGDSISLSPKLNDMDLEVDSVIWKVWLVNVMGEKEVITISKDSCFSFRVRPHLFGCTFKKAVSPQFGFLSAYDGQTLCINPDSCRFVCTVYAHKYGDSACLSIVSRNYFFDVIPKCPVLEEVETWSEEGDEDWPITRLKIDTERYEYVSIYVIQENPNRFETFQDTVFSKDFGLEYIIEPRGWGNSIYCYVWNDYGTYKSAPLRILRPSYISSKNADGMCKVMLWGKRVRVECEDISKVCVYDMNGKLYSCSDVGEGAEITLHSGQYILKVEKKNNQRLLTKKIQVR